MEHSQSNVSVSIGIRSDTPDQVTLVVESETGWSMVQTWSPDHARSIGAALMDTANEVDMQEYRQEGEHPIDRLIREINTSAEDTRESGTPPEGGSRADGPMFGTQEDDE